MILDPGFNLSLRPMKYPIFYEMYKNGIKNTWTVDEVDFSTDLVDLQTKLTSAEKHLISRLVAFFATGDSIVGNNLVINLYKHINAPEARLYLSRQLYEEALHVQFYLTLLDTYVPDHAEREQAFTAITSIPSIRQKGEFCFKYMDSINDLHVLHTAEDRRKFLMNLACFASCIEGLFFFGAFAYIYFLRSKGLLAGLASGTNWVFRDESMHIAFSYEVINTVRREEPTLLDTGWNSHLIKMLDDAIAAEMSFAHDILDAGVAGLNARDMLQYLRFVADQRLVALGVPAQYKVKNPFPFLELQDMQELANFFERRVSAYQIGVTGQVAFNEAF